MVACQGKDENITEPHEASRSLLVRNLNRNLKIETLYNEFESFGRLQNLDYRHLKEEGFVVIDYYDLRHSVKAYKTLSLSLSWTNPSLCQPGTRLDVHYFATLGSPPMGPNENEGKLLICAPHATDIKPFLQRFGEIRKAMITGKTTDSSLWIVEFYDIRAAAETFNNLHGYSFDNRRVKVTFLNGFNSWVNAGFTLSIEGEARPLNLSSLSSMQTQVTHSTHTPPHSKEHDSRQSRYSPFPSPLSSRSQSRSRSPSPPPTMSPPQSRSFISSLPLSTLNTTSSNMIIPSHPFGINIPSSNSANPSSDGYPPSPPTSPPSQCLSPPHHHNHVNHHVNQASIDAKHHPTRIPEGFHIVLENIRSGLERRTTLMVRNIPNKYTQEMFLEFVNETHKGKYDFIYLPIDFKNKCNVGYAFINFIDPISIIDLYNRIQGKKWTRFNSDKICAVSFGRIQGKENLIKHFQNSTIMSESSDYRPKIFFSTGPMMGLEEIFPEPNVSYTPTFDHKLCCGDSQPKPTCFHLEQKHEKIDKHEKSYLSAMHNMKKMNEQYLNQF